MREELSLKSLSSSVSRAQDTYSFRALPGKTPPGVDPNPGGVHLKPGRVFKKARRGLPVRSLALRRVDVYPSLGWTYVHPWVGRISIYRMDVRQSFSGSEPDGILATLARGERSAEHAPSPHSAFRAPLSSRSDELACTGKQKGVYWEHSLSWGGAPRGTSRHASNTKKMRCRILFRSLEISTFTKERKVQRKRVGLFPACFLFVQFSFRAVLSLQREHYVEKHALCVL